MVQNPGLWSKENLKKVANLQRPFNAKLTRILKQTPLAERYLPKRITKQHVMETVETQEDLNRMLEDWRDFLRWEKETLVQRPHYITTKWNEERIQRRVALINERRKRELEEAHTDQEAFLYTGMLKRTLAPKTYEPEQITNLEAYERSVEKQSRELYQKEKWDQYKENYLMTIVKWLGVSQPNAISLYSFVDSLPAQFVYDSYFDSALVQIEYVYPGTSKENTESHAERILQEWKYLWSVYDKLENED